MSRWKVQRTTNPLIAIIDDRQWEVRNPEGKLVHPLHETHAEALDYADREARTVEVTLPRLRPQGEVTVSATWDYDQQSIHYINPAGATVQGTPADLRPLACALLAYAEQEGA